LLAITTIKPHLVVLLIVLIIIWGIYKQRWGLIGGFFGSLTALVVVGVAIIPNWISQNMWEILKYPAYNPAGTLAEAIAEWIPGIDNQLKWGIAIALGTLLFIEWWAARKAGFDRFLWVSFLTLGIGQWIGIQTDPGNFILLFPALVYILAVWDFRWEEKGHVIVCLGLASILLGLWILFVATIERGYQPIQNSVMFIPLPALVIIGLYWIKWWVISPMKTFQVNQS
jgi:hypothetical protein